MSGNRAADAWPSRSRRSARWLAALAFAAAAVTVFLLVFVGHIGPAVQLPRSALASVVLIAGAIAGAAFFGQMLWTWLAARRRGPSWIGAIVAAIVTVPLASLTAWVFVLVATEPHAAPEGVAEWLDAIKQIGLAVGMLTTLSTIRFAPIAVPLAILASLAATLFYRRRLQRVELPSYASPAEAGP